MLSIFPQILYLGPVGITIIRVAAGLTVMYTGWTLIGESAAVARAKFPIIGRCPEWLCKLGGIIQIGVGALLVVGLYTQLVAIPAGAVALKCFVWGGEYQKIIPISRTASLLLLAISLCLIVSGAGAFALDLPL